MYSSSANDWRCEQTSAHDVVAYIDAHYRTIPKRLTRDELVGHSMGVLAPAESSMKHPGDPAASTRRAPAACPHASAAQPTPPAIRFWRQ